MDVCVWLRGKGFLKNIFFGLGSKEIFFWEGMRKGYNDMEWWYL